MGTRRRLRAMLAAVMSLAVALPAAALAGPGALDTSFGSGGATLSQFSEGATNFTMASAEAIAPNGDIYQAGITDDASGNNALYLARYLPSGALDPSFGAGGVSVQQIGKAAKGAASLSGTNLGVLQTIALTPSGEVIVPTTASDPSGGMQIAVAEFTSKGALDPSFGSGGVYYDDSESTTTPKEAYAIAAAAQSDGKIVITADANLASGSRALVQRLTASGTLDSGFATGGTYVAPHGATVPTQINGVIVDSAGNIVFTGSAADKSGDPGIMLGRLTSTGLVSAGFPVVLQASPESTPDSSGYSVIQAPDGDYVVGADAYVDDPASGLAGGAIPSWVAVAFTATGSVDTAFGPSGTGISGLLEGDTAPFSIAQQANGRLVYAGDTSVGGAAPAVEVVRTLANGTLDTSFDGTGIATFAFGSLATAPSGAIGPDGQLTISGTAVSVTSASTVVEAQALLAKLTLDTPPSVVLAAPASPVAGQPVFFSAAAVGDGSISSLRWDLGSGAFTDASGPTATRTFASPGTYTVRVQATDDDGLSSTATQTISVAAAPPPPATVTTPPATITTPPTTVTVPTPIPAAECTSSSKPTARVIAKILSSQGLLLTGRAAANCPSHVASVSIAIARVKGRKCAFLGKRHHWGSFGKCTPRAYLPAVGNYTWAVGLKLKFGRGTYWAWPRATDDHGVSSTVEAKTHLTLRAHD